MKYLFNDGLKGNLFSSLLFNFFYVIPEQNNA